MEYTDLLKEVSWSASKNLPAGLSYDSRKVKPGDIFICIKGFKTDGHNYVSQALSQGARIIVSEKPLLLNGQAELVVVDNTRKALSELGAACYNHPSSRLKVYGVTGTNGKTTTTYMIDHIMKKAGFKTGLIGTMEIKIDDKTEKTKNTTPESLDLQEIFYKMVLDGVDTVAMEVSSHALSLYRVWNAFFTGVIYTNFSQDHLDFHSTLEDYWKVKASFLSLQKEFISEKEVFSVFNKDDPEVIKLLPHGNGQKFIYGLMNEKTNMLYREQGNILMAYDVSCAPGGTRFNLNRDGHVYNFNLKLIGVFNVYNALAAIAAGLAQNIDLSLIKEAIEELPPVKGRIYPVYGEQDFTCIVDYAHTPDGLKKVLQSARAFTKGRIITVFGCGGDRDKSKRPVMGHIGVTLSDYIIITSDNPRSEDPLAIIRDIEAGITNTSRYVVEPDRKRAIEKALDIADRGDCVIVAGKGHEDYQIFADKTVHFDDSEIIREYFELAGRK